MFTLLLWMLNESVRDIPDEGVDGPKISASAKLVCIRGPRV